MSDVKLLKQHEHKGKLHPEGTVLTVSDSDADWLKAQNVAVDYVADLETPTVEMKGGKNGKRS